MRTTSPPCHSTARPCCGAVADELGLTRGSGGSRTIRRPQERTAPDPVQGHQPRAPAAALQRRPGPGGAAALDAGPRHRSHASRRPATGSCCGRSSSIGSSARSSAPATTGYLSAPRRPAVACSRRRRSTGCSWRCSCRRCCCAATSRCNAELAWGPQRKPKTFLLTPATAWCRTSPTAASTCRPSWACSSSCSARRSRLGDAEETEVFPLGDGFWVPDFRLVSGQPGGRCCSKCSASGGVRVPEVHLQRLQHHATQPFLLAVSDRLRIEEAELEGLPAGVHRFRQMPLPDEVARLAEELVG